MPSTSVEQRRGKRVDQVVGRDTEGLDLPELEDIRRTIRQPSRRHPKSSVFVVGRSDVDSVSFLLQEIAALPLTNSSEKAGTSGGAVGTLRSHVGNIESVTHSGRPTGTDLLHHVTDQHVGEEIVT